MPSFPLPPPAVPGGGDLPVVTTQDVLTLLPKGIQQPQTAPVRDALVGALTQIALSWQEAASYAAAEADIGRSTDQWLSGNADDRSFNKQATETDPAFRARSLGVPATVSTAAIVSAINAILAPYTAIPCRVFDSVLDRMYVFDGTVTSRSYVAGSAGLTFPPFSNAGPNYPDRLYPEYASQNGGAFLPNSSPGGAWPFGDCIGRYLVVRITDLAPTFLGHAYTTNTLLPTVALSPFKHLYVFTGSAPGTGTRAFINQSSQTALGVYQSIVNTVNSLIGQSIRWQLFVDPRLTT
jgi:hypothetical protein